MPVWTFGNVQANRHITYGARCQTVQPCEEQAIGKQRSEAHE